MARSERIGIVGAGAFGAGLAAALGRAGRPTVIWSRDPAVVESIRAKRVSPRLPAANMAPSVVATADPRVLAAEARFIVLAVASTDVRARAIELGNVLDGNHIVVHAVGALAEPTQERVSDVVAAGISTPRIGVLAGPALPMELANGNFASLVVASQFDEVVQEARRLLNVPPTLRVYGSRDLPGVEISSALAGAYAIGLGLADGLGIGPGIRAVLISRTVAEASRLVAALDGDGRSFSGLAGLGNLLARSDRTLGSDEYRWGQQLAAGKAASQSAAGAALEGVRAAAALYRLAAAKHVHVPLLTAIAGILAGKVTIESAAQLATDSVAEHEQ